MKLTDWSSLLVVYRNSDHIKERRQGNAKRIFIKRKNLNEKVVLYNRCRFG